MSRWTLLKAVCAALALCFSPLQFAAEAPQETTQQYSQVDINKADAAAIAAALDGIGLVKAEEIVAYRTMFGEFRTVDELLEVPGIGEVTLEKNRSKILISAN